MPVSGEFGIIGRNHPSTVRNLGSPTNMEWKDTMQSRAEGTNWQRGKDHKDWYSFIR